MYNFAMEILDELIKILDKHECKCFDIDEENFILNYIGSRFDCCSVDPAIADITGFLLINNVDYTMTSDNDIIIKR